MSEVIPLDESEKALICILIKERLAGEPAGAVYRAYEAIGTKMRRNWTVKAVNRELKCHTLSKNEEKDSTKK